MKIKNFLLFFVLLGVSSSNLHAQGQIKAPKVTSAILVDGVVDASWGAIQWLDMHAKFGSAVTVAADYNVQFKMAWYNNTIYVLCKLTDDVIASHSNLTSSDGWKRDFLTIYFDFYPWGNYSYTESPHAFYYRTNIGSMQDIRTDGRFRDNMSAPVGVMSGVSLIAGGAYVEFSVDATKFTPNALAQGSEFGFQLEGGDCDNLVTPARTRNWWYNGDGSAWETPAGRLAWAILDKNVSTNLVQGTAQSKVNIYPTITSNTFVVNNIDGVENIDIFNVSGVRVLNIGKVSEKMEINVSAFDNGIYYVRFNGVNSVTQKVIVQ